MDNLYTIENRVKAVLEKYPQARDDDMKLYLLICQEALRMVPNGNELSFAYVFTHYESLGCPRYESVRRTRQMVQKKHPELGCSPVVLRMREQGREDFKKYSIAQKEVS